MKKLPRSESQDAAELTARQEQVIQALLTGVSVQEAAKTLHVGRTTIYIGPHEIRTLQNNLSRSFTRRLITGQALRFKSYPKTSFDAKIWIPGLALLARKDRLPWAPGAGQRFCC